MNFLIARFGVHGTVDRKCTSLSIANKMQRYTTFFITVNALQVSGGISAHHQELKNCTHSIEYMSSLLAATASVGELAVAVAPVESGLALNRRIVRPLTESDNTRCCNNTI
jgi:hypothetical protein